MILPWPPSTPCSLALALIEHAHKRSERAPSDGLPEPEPIRYQAKPATSRKISIAGKAPYSAPTTSALPMGWSACRMVLLSAYRANLSRSEVRSRW